VLHHLQHSFLLDYLINFSLQPQTLVILGMAVNMSASKEATTKQRVPVLLITSWRVMERPAEVLDSFVLSSNSFWEQWYNVPTNL